MQMRLRPFLHTSLSPRAESLLTESVCYLQVKLKPSNLVAVGSNAIFLQFFSLIGPHGSLKYNERVNFYKRLRRGYYRH